MTPGKQPEAGQDPRASADPGESLTAARTPGRQAAAGFVRVLTGLLGTPTYHIGIMLSWLLPPAPRPGGQS